MLSDKLLVLIGHDEGKRDLIILETIFREEG